MFCEACPVSANYTVLIYDLVWFICLNSAGIRQSRSLYEPGTSMLHIKYTKLTSRLHYSWINEYLTASYLRQIIQQLNFDHVIFCFTV